MSMEPPNQNPPNAHHKLLQNPRYTLFVGNPGVGKSTLLNGILGKIKFPSGFSSGSGLTQTFNCFEHPPNSNQFYGDTPGLQDSDKRKEAAAEIEKGLKQGGLYRLVFVVTLEAGRASPDDATTIRLISEAVPRHIPCLLVINKVTQILCDEINTEEATSELLVSLSPPGRATMLCLLPEEAQIEDEDNVLPSVTVMEFLTSQLESLPFSPLDASEVQNVKYDQFEDLQQRMSEEIQRLKYDKQLLQKMFEETVKEKEQALNLLTTYMQETQQLNEEMKNKLSKMSNWKYCLMQLIHKLF